MIRAGVLGAASVMSAITITGEPAVAGCSAEGCDPLCIEIGRYQVRGEVVVDGRDHDRLWQRRATEQLPHPDAARYCAALALDDVTGWRLPSPGELSGLRYKPGGLFGGHGRHYCIPSIDQEAFPETPAAEFWTAETSGYDTARYVDFADGRTHRAVQSDPLWVRCVRDPL
jgi:hypothetical protein